MVKELREKTGVGMMDCKNALVEADGDLDKAVEILRKKGLSKAAKKSCRAATEGLVASLVKDNRGALVEINSETDFVAKNDAFRGFVDGVASVVLEHKPADMDALMALPFPGTGRTVEEEQTHQVATIGENIRVRRFSCLEVPTGYVSSYIHMGGKIGVIVAFQTANDKVSTSEFQTLAADISMHVCAADPRFTNRSEVPSDELGKEKEILVAQMKADPKNAKKPEDILVKIVEGKLGKYYSENCLLEQPFVKEPSETVEQVVAKTGSAMGVKVEVTGFARFKLGEGLEKKEEDFAAEVANAFN
jgi:elongation factor Ts